MTRVVCVYADTGNVVPCEYKMTMRDSFRGVSLLLLLLQYPTSEEFFIKPPSVLVEKLLLV